MEISSKNTENSIKRAKIKSPEYPGLLKQIHAPPPVLYYRGFLPQNASLIIAVVGSRKITAYGQQAVEKIILPLVGEDVCIISGLAYGVDAYAHEMALRAGLKTIAVLGSGLDVDSIYPLANRGLAHKIIAAGGAIISEFAPGTKGMPYNFPRRNRIISGMSQAVIVVEAAAKSGALITADYALEQNRDVFAVPGSIFSKFSEGTNNEIKKGAKPITETQDLLREYPQFFSDKELKPGLRRDSSNLSETEIKILNCISHEPVNADLIKTKTQLETAEINSTLIILEIKGRVRECGGQNFILPVS